MVKISDDLIIIHSPLSMLSGLIKSQVSRKPKCFLNCINFLIIYLFLLVFIVLGVLGCSDVPMFQCSWF